MMKVSTTARAGGRGNVPQTLAERFWSIAKGMDLPGEPGDPTAAVSHVLAVLDALDRNATGPDLSTNTVSFLMMLRQQEMMGDLLYASPEQARGETVDERSLVFSVGVLLFERLTGRHPFGVEGNPKRMARIRKGELGSGVNYFPVVPAGLRIILLRAMGPFPEERYSTLAELRRKLEEFLAEATGENRPATAKALSEAVRVQHQRESARRAAEEEVTRVVQRRAPAPSAAADAATSATQGAGAGRDLFVGRPEIAVPELRKGGTFLGRIGWMTMGAAVTAAVFLIARPTKTATTNNGGTTATLTSPSPSPSPSTILPANANATANANANAPANEPRGPQPAPPAPAAAAEPDVPATFDPQLGGERALTAARACFSDKRIASGVGFGLSLVYGADDGVSRKIYLALNELEPSERACLAKSLVGIHAGAAPGKSTVIDYRFHLRGETGDVKIRAHKPPAPRPSTDL
jgi:hypothetical protein